MPARGGGLEELRHFIPAGNDDWRTILTWLLAALRPVGPYPVLLLHGEQGSAKSSTARLLRSLVDPAAAPLRIQPRNARDLMIAATLGHVLAIDNLSHMAPWFSDALCSIATGAGFATRVLFTDDEEKIFTGQRPVILNGIEEVATNGDLLDRALLVYLPHIPAVQRRAESDLVRDFDEAHPRIFGALLDAVARGLHNLPNVKRNDLPRMADFARWGCAVAPVLGWTEHAFLAAYAANREAADDIALESSPVAPVLLDMMEREHLSWEGTAGELHKLLTEKAGERASKQKSWPNGARALSNTLRRLSPNLRRVGIDVTFLDRLGNRRPIRIENAPAAASFASPASSPEAD